jgi:hypothetical protein
MRVVGRDFAHRQFVELSNQPDTSLLDTNALRDSLIGAARLTSMICRNSKSPVRYYKRALLGAKPALAANLTYEIANLYARRRNTDDLDHARRWCARGSTILAQIQNMSDRLYADIRIHNVRALVEYHSGNNEHSLALERAAYSLAVRALKEDAPIGKWALAVVRSNMAKLFEKRFESTTLAMSLLEENLMADDPAVVEHARIELARLHFEQGHHPKVVELLSNDYEGQPSATLNEQRELFGRLMLSVGLTLLGDQTRLRRQLRWISYLHRVVGKTNV